jgi:hypothetical protein
VAGDADDDDSDRDNDYREISGQPRRRIRQNEDFDGYAVELVRAVAAELRFQVEFYAIDDEPRQRLQGGTQSAASGWSSRPGLNRPGGGWSPRGTASGGGHHQQQQQHRSRVSTTAADHGTWSGLIEQLLSEVIDIYTTARNWIRREAEKPRV